MIRLYLKIQEKFVSLIFQDEMHILFVIIVKFKLKLLA